jgi:aminopeptidase-like protein
MEDHMRECHPDIETPGWPAHTGKHGAHSALAGHPGTGKHISALMIDDIELCDGEEALLDIAATRKWRELAPSTVALPSTSATNNM